MELFFIRHAQSTNNALQDYSLRTADPALTDLGRRQAELLAAHLAAAAVHETRPSEGEPPDGGDGTGFGITRLITSPMLRTLLTTRPVARALGLRPEVWPDIHEQGGVWQDHGGERGIVGYPGLSRAEMLAHLPGAILPETVTDAGWYDPGLGQETPERAYSRAGRVVAALHETARRAPAGARIALIAHGAFGGLFLAALFGRGPDAPLFFHHDNTGITWIHFRDDGEIRVRYMNRVSHLPADMVT